MKPELSIFGQPDAATDEEALCEGEADAEAGRVVSHEVVGNWLLTWGTPDESPMPESWLK